MPSIFICYRREDTQALSGRLLDRLVARYGREHVFRDIDAIEPGARFTEVIRQRIGRCKVLIAVVGHNWLEAKDAEDRRRLDLPDDFVKAEIAEALAQNKHVIPVLVEGATMPARESLPPEISAIAEINALPISDSRFDFDVGRLISTIDAVVRSNGATAPRLARFKWMFWAGIAVVLGTLSLFVGRTLTTPDGVNHGPPSGVRAIQPKDTTASGQEVATEDPVVVFEYDLANGWKIRNIGKSAAIDVLVSERSFSGNWTAPVRLPPLAAGQEHPLDWVQHRNVDVLGARYVNIENQIYSAVCQRDKSLIERGSVFPDWKETEIRAHWKVGAAGVPITTNKTGPPDSKESIPSEEGRGHVDTEKRHD
jgi:hypothetical protein